MYLFAREPSKWRVGDVEHLGRLLFSLSTKQINSIPLVSTQKHQNCTNLFIALEWTLLFCCFPVQAVLNKDTVEQVLVGQSLWEDSRVGRVCISQHVDQQHQREQTQSLIRGIIKARRWRAKGSINTSFNFTCKPLLCCM